MSGSKRKSSSLFGFANVKTREELRAIGCSKKVNSKSPEAFELDAQEALFVPILSNARAKHISNLKGYGLSSQAISRQTRSSRFAQQENNPYEIVDAPAYRRTSSAVNKSTKQCEVSDSLAKVKGIPCKRIGIYSTSAKYCRELESHLDTALFECNYFGLCQEMVPSQLQQAQSIDLWVVNLLDEDDAPCLDQIMELCAEKSALFLLENNPTRQCLSKLAEFLNEAA